MQDGRNGGLPWGSDLSFYISALDFIFNAVEGELASKEFKRIAAPGILECRVESRQGPSPVDIYGFANC